MNRLVIAVSSMSKSSKTREKGDAAKSDLSLCAIYCCDRVKVNRGDKRDPFVDKRREISNDSSRRFFLSVH